MKISNNKGFKAGGALLLVGAGLAAIKMDPSKLAETAVRIDYSSRNLSTLSSAEIERQSQRKTMSTTMEQKDELIARAIKPATLPDLFSDPALFNDPAAREASKAFESHEKTYVIVLTQARSGSSFAGSIFNADSSDFYLFEPFMTPAYNEKGQEVRDLKDVLSCNFNVHKRPIANDLQCFRSKHCTTEEFQVGKKANIPPIEELRQSCLQSNRRIIKTIRINDIHEIVSDLVDKEGPDVRVRVIHLVRDPIGVSNSMKQVCNSGQFKGCFNDMKMAASKFCSVMERQASYADVARLVSMAGGDSGNSFMTVRYEDLDANNAGWARYLYAFAYGKFADIEGGLVPLYNEELETYIDQSVNTEQEKVGFYDLQKSKRKLSLESEEIEVVESLCSRVMQTYGYV